MYIGFNSDGTKWLVLKWNLTQFLFCRRHNYIDSETNFHKLTGLPTGKIKTGKMLLIVYNVFGRYIETTNIPFSHGKLNDKLNLISLIS
jgi:hypothetical protein